MAKLIDVKVPDLGGSQDVPIIELLVKHGEAIGKDTVLLVLESDKATMEVPSPSGGTVRNLKVKVGDKLSPGQVICQLESPEAAEPAPVAAAPAPTASVAPAPAVAPSSPRQQVRWPRLPHRAPSPHSVCSSPISATTRTCR